MDDLFKRRKKDIEEIKESKIIRQNLIKDVPGIKNFNKWFDELSVEEFDIVWKNEKLKNKVKSRIRHPGGLHEWLMVSRANVFKNWGITANKIKILRTEIDKVIFKNPPGYHGGPGSTKAHNEILDLIDTSESYDEFKNKLINWSEKRLNGGKESLPKEFFN
ncbi:hypothetical protein FT986_11445 [Mesonia sp. K4-1]|nr:hypothetical protein FT986_11445 [Mesonia sp. K4-1]